MTLTHPIIGTLIVALALCPPSGLAQNKDYRLGSDGIKNLDLGTSKVGTVVMMNLKDKGSPPSAALAPAFMSALMSGLRKKGYDPAPLYTGVSEKVSFLNPVKSLRNLRPALRQPVFDTPAVKDVAAVFVVWVQLKLEKPSFGGLGAVGLGTVPVWEGRAYLEVFSADGDPLVMVYTPVHGYSLGSSQGTYAVLTPDEVAASAIAPVLFHLRPYAVHK